jgi:prepilin-type N-terminal cleavage/methylation domain-containing protein
VHTRSNSGFTLIELVIVSGLILLIMGLAVPALLPAFAFSELEGSARHVSNFGRSAAAYAGFSGEYIIVKIDLDASEYWAIELIDEPPTLFEETEPETEMDEQEALAALVASQSENSGAGGVVSEEALLMEQRFERFFRRTLEAQAKNVKHEGSLFADVGPLFEDEFSLRDEDEDTDREINDVLMLRTTLPEGVIFESIMIGNERHTTGIVEIEVSPLGLTDTVTFYILRGEDQYYTVVWDPITGSSRMSRGKIESEDQADES